MKYLSSVAVGLLLLLNSITLPSCSSKASLKREFAGIMDKEVFLPQNLQATYNGADTILTGFMDSRSKMIIYFDSTGCSSCAINHLYEWNGVIATSEGMPGRFNAMFIFSPKKSDVHGVRISLMSTKLNYPVYLDLTGEFARLNPEIAANSRFHKLLLNKSNRILLVGNPVGNDPLWELYKETIKEQ